MSHAEYEASVGELNKQHHERAEMLVLYKQGVLPLRSDEDDQPDVDTGKSNKARRRLS